jgi:hypothetical protein
MPWREGLFDDQTAGGIGEAEFAGRGDRTGCNRHEEGLGEARTQGGIVGVERERVAELFRGGVVDQVERGTLVVILVLLEYPRGDLRAAVGEGDAVEFIFDDGLRLGLRDNIVGCRRGRDGWRRRGSR